MTTYRQRSISLDNDYPNNLRSLIDSSGSEDESSMSSSAPSNSFINNAMMSGVTLSTISEESSPEIGLSGILMSSTQPKSPIRRKRAPNESNPKILASLEEDLKKRTAKRRAKILKRQLGVSSLNASLPIPVNHDHNSTSGSTNSSSFSNLTLQPSHSSSSISSIASSSSSAPNSTSTSPINSPSYFASSPIEKTNLKQDTQNGHRRLVRSASHLQLLQLQNQQQQALLQQQQQQQLQLQQLQRAQGQGDFSGGYSRDPYSSRPLFQQTQSPQPQTQLTQQPQSQLAQDWVSYPRVRQGTEVYHDPFLGTTTNTTTTTHLPTTTTNPTILNLPSHYATTGNTNLTNPQSYPYTYDFHNVLDPRYYPTTQPTPSVTSYVPQDPQTIPYGSTPMSISPSTSSTSLTTYETPTTSVNTTQPIISNLQPQPITLTQQPTIQQIHIPQQPLPITQQQTTVPSSLPVDLSNGNFPMTYEEFIMLQQWMRTNSIDLTGVPSIIMNGKEFPLPIPGVSTTPSTSSSTSLSTSTSTINPNSSNPSPSPTPPVAASSLSPNLPRFSSSSFDLGNIDINSFFASSSEFSLNGLKKVPSNSSSVDFLTNVNVNIQTPLQSPLQQHNR